MREELYRAELWLNRNFNDAKRLEADERMLEVLEGRLASCVAKYETDGTQSRDSDAARARHEDTLLDYSTQKQKVETESKKLMAEITRTRAAIDELGDNDLIAVAVDRYINRLRWKDISKVEHVSHATVYRLRLKMLEKMAEILHKKNLI